MSGRLNALTWLVLWLPRLAAAEDLQQERAGVRELLSAERAAFTAAREQKIRVLEALEFTEQLARASSARARALDLELAALRGRLEFVRGQRDAASGRLIDHLQRLQPRLFLLYRLSREHPLKALLSAADFSSLMWRWRALRALLRGDLEALSAAKRLFDYEELMAAELAGLEADLGAWRGLAGERAREAAARRKELGAVVAALQADAAQSKRVIAELEEEDRALTKLIKALQLSQSSGFASLKGQLPIPVDGTLEVGFGKVVNPKFNTVTVQKGWDLRADEGAEVRAIAAGQVAYAGWLRGYGNVLIIDHGGGFHSLFAHLASLTRGVGEAIQAGEAIGAVGDSGSLKGAYLYFEIRHDGEAVDPAPWIHQASPTTRRRSAMDGR